MKIAFTEQGREMLHRVYPNEPVSTWDSVYDVVIDETAVQGSYLLPIPLYAHGLWVQKHYCNIVESVKDYKIPVELFDWKE